LAEKTKDKSQMTNKNQIQNCNDSKELCFLVRRGELLFVISGLTGLGF